MAAAQSDEAQSDEAQSDEAQSDRSRCSKTTGSRLACGHSCRFGGATRSLGPAVNSDVDHTVPTGGLDHLRNGWISGPRYNLCDDRSSANQVGGATDRFDTPSAWLVTARTGTSRRAVAGHGPWRRNRADPGPDVSNRRPIARGDGSPARRRGGRTVPCRSAEAARARTCPLFGSCRGAATSTGLGHEEGGRSRWRSISRVDRPRGLPPGAGILLVIEIKTEIRDFGAIERAFGWYQREGQGVALRFGWRQRSTRGCLLLLATQTSDARAAADREAFDIGFPVRARELAGLVGGTRAPTRDGRAVAMIDPRSRRHAWLRPLRIDGRRSPAPYIDYADFMRALGPGSVPPRRC